MKVITNHHWRQMVYRTDVPTKTLESNFSHLNAEEDSDYFFCYLGQWYHLSDFLRSPNIVDWDGYSSDSYFSGVVIKLSRDGESIMVGRYYA